MVYYNPDQPVIVQEEVDLFNQLKNAITAGTIMELIENNEFIEEALYRNEDGINDEQDDNGNTLTMIAVKEDRFVFLNYMLECELPQELPQDLTLVNNNGKTLLNILVNKAVEEKAAGNIDLIRYIDSYIVNCLSKMYISGIFGIEAYNILTAIEGDQCLKDILVATGLNNAVLYFDEYLTIVSQQIPNLLEEVLANLNVGEEEQEEEEQDNNEENPQEIPLDNNEGGVPEEEDHDGGGGGDAEEELPLEEDSSGEEDEGGYYSSSPDDDVPLAGEGGVPPNEDIA